MGAISCLVIGIYTHEVEYGSRQMSNLIGVSMYRADSVMMIGGGSAIIAITLLGFIGVYKQHRCMVGMVGLLSRFNLFIYCTDLFKFFIAPLHRDLELLDI